MDIQPGPKKKNIFLYEKERSWINNFYRYEG